MSTIKLCGITALFGVFLGDKQTSKSHGTYRMLPGLGYKGHCMKRGRGVWDNYESHIQYGERLTSEAW